MSFAHRAASQGILPQLTVIPPEGDGSSGVAETTAAREKRVVTAKNLKRIGQIC